MSVVAQVLAWLLLAAFFVAVVCNAAGPMEAIRLRQPIVDFGYEERG